MLRSGRAERVRRIGASLAGVVLLLACSWQAAAAEERRVALVIGNGAYQHATRLANPANDANAMAEMLGRAGFKVLSGTDLSRVEMEDLIARFEAEVAGADATVAFFAGHGIQVDGRNYLLPVDAKLEQRSDLRRLISADWLVEEAGRAERLSLVILDACRDNPLARSFASHTRGAGVGRGLAQIQDQPANTLIAYATAADATAADGTGANSPFTAALVEHLPTPGLEIGLALRKVRDSVIARTSGQQQPFTYGSIGGEEFYLVSSSAPKLALLEYGGRDRQAFEAIEDSTRARDFQVFVDRFPQSALVPFALDRLNELERPTETAVTRVRPVAPASKGPQSLPAPTVIPRLEAPIASETPTAQSTKADAPAELEAALSLGAADWRLLQRALKNLGFDAGPPDGRPGFATRKAIAAWQAHEGKDVTGYLLADQRDAVLLAEQAVSSPSEPDGKSELGDARWFRKAAESGRADAQSNLGDAYANGRGVKRDDSEAVRWYRKAAEQDFADAQNNLGVMYWHGRGVKQDDSEAMRWFRKAAAQGLAFAQNNIGAAFASGRGVPKDAAEAVRWYRKAADQGLALAQDNLGTMYGEGVGVTQDDAEATRWYRKAAEQGYAIAQYNLGFSLANGLGVERDDTEAVRWYRKAADQGNAGAQNNLGWMYENGRGVPKNVAEAARWYRKAADQGHERAKKNLAQL